MCKKIPRIGTQARGFKGAPGTLDRHHKGDVEKPTYRSRFVFAVTAPLEAPRLLVSNAATVEKCPDSAFKEETKAIMVNDVARAFEALVAKGDCSRAV